jgi:hypothetical protein
MSIQDGSKAVTDCFTANGAKPLDLPAALYALHGEVQKRGLVFDKCFPTCRNDKGGLFYGPGFHEIEVWQVGLFFIEYVARLLLDKAAIGHCYAENRTNPVCSLSRSMHQEMLGRLVQDLRGLAQEIEDLEKGESPTWATADPHPTPK